MTSRQVSRHQSHCTHSIVLSIPTRSYWPKKALLGCARVCCSHFNTQSATNVHSRYFAASPCGLVTSVPTRGPAASHWVSASNLITCFICTSLYFNQGRLWSPARSDCSRAPTWLPPARPRPAIYSPQHSPCRAAIVAWRAARMANLQRPTSLRIVWKVWKKVCEKCCFTLLFLLFL